HYTMLYFFYSYHHPPHLHSFPTRRSSDLKSFPRSKHMSYKSLSIFPEIAPVSTKSEDCATPFIEIGDCSISKPFDFRRPINSLCTRFATVLGFFADFAASSNWSANALLYVSTCAS